MVNASRPSNPLAAGGLLALLAAVAFGVTTPLIQRVGHGLGTFTTAALLYAGAAVVSLGPASRKQQREAPVRRAHLPRLVAIALSGAVVAPACLVWGLQHTSASGASLLLNFEAVFTVLLAWRLYREPIGRRVVAALMLMVVAGAFLVLAGPFGGLGWGAGAVVVATFGWALDNTLTRPLADLNPTQVVRWKGLLGALFGAALALALREPLPAAGQALGLVACGATGYGVSLRLYLLAQRRLGAGRTGSIFALAPFVGAAAAWGLGERTAGWATLAAATLFGAAVYLHLTEEHHHRHTHERLEHEHAHRHDDGHHDHVHDDMVEGEHSHVHQHDERTHDHPHGPDLHHHHRHS